VGLVDFEARYLRYALATASHYLGGLVFLLAFLALPWTLDRMVPLNALSDHRKDTMNKLKKTLFAVLGIGAAMGLGSLIVSPGGFWIKTPVGEKWAPKPGDKDSGFTWTAYHYRRMGYLPYRADDMCGMGAEIAGQKEGESGEELNARVIAEAKRQEAQEASWPRLP
jgi:hypothetical protein